MNYKNLNLKKICVWLLVALLLMVSALAFFVRDYLRFRAQENQLMLDSTLTQADDLGKPAVTVVRDSYGVPHIFANTRLASAQALGGMHVKHRLWQMHMARMAAKGELATLFGKSMLPLDRFMRGFNLKQLAKTTQQHLPTDTLALLQSYTQGVNANLSNQALPLEFTLVGAHVPKWTVEDSILVGLLMSIQLGTNFKEQRLILADALAGRQSALRHALPALNNPNDTAMLDFLEQPVQAQAASSAVSAYKHAPAQSVSAKYMPDKNMLDSNIFSNLYSTASNVWAVQKTPNNPILLANDPHLGLEAPILWYLVRMHVGGSAGKPAELKGATLPGLPVVISGQSSHLAWGITLLNGDNQELTLERDQQGGQYETATGAKPYSLRTEVFHIKGDDDVTLTYRESQNGVIVSDYMPALAKLTPKGHAMALNVGGLVAPYPAITAFDRLNQATSVFEAQRIIQSITAPIINIALADTQNNIAIQAVGHVPAHSNQAKHIQQAGSGLLPHAGWQRTTGIHDAPKEELPSIVNPNTGFVANANQNWSATTWSSLLPSWTLNGVGNSHERQKRIVSLLSTGHNTFAKMQQMQNDTLLPNWQLLVRTIQSIQVDPKAEDAQLIQQSQAQLTDWDGQVVRESVAATVVAAWFDVFYDALVDQQLPHTKRALRIGRMAMVLDAISGHSVYCSGAIIPRSESAIPNVTTIPNASTALGATNTAKAAPKRSCAEVAAQALIQSTALLKNNYHKSATHWQWGRVHQADLVSKFWSKTPLRAFADLTTPTDGHFYTLKRGSSKADTADFFKHDHGAGYKAVYDVTNPDNSVFILATGQSGDPFNRHYGDMVQPWADGEYIDLSGTVDELLENNATKIILLPAR